VIQKVQRDVASVMGETEIKARLYVQGMSPVVNSTADFTKQLDQELVRWATVVAARKLQAN
jgi:tripartite-type tricarboxylate transporter receptor subunit TctC